VTVEMKVAVFLAATAGIAWVSRASLRSLRSHGLYRFFAWEAILALAVLNIDVWFVEPFSIHQIVSWLLLLVSLFLVIHGFRLLHLVGQPDGSREDPALLGVEKTTRLVKVGAYRYIRHPLYSSLLFLAWGVFFKDPSWVGGTLALVATFSLTLAARMEETENLAFFGPGYREYMAQTKMFIPLLF
jgi:protein-S-isoprenylcysteine O-methyltransferase Ste14